MAASMTKPSLFGIVPPSSATASARCLVRVKSHSVAWTGYVPFSVHPSMSSQAVVAEANVNCVVVSTL